MEKLDTNRKSGRFLRVPIPTVVADEIDAGRKFDKNGWVNGQPKCVDWLHLRNEAYDRVSRRSRDAQERGIIVGGGLEREFSVRRELSYLFSLLVQLK